MITLLGLLVFSLLTTALLAHFGLISLKKDLSFGGVGLSVVFDQDIPIELLLYAGSWELQLIAGKDLD